MEEYKVNLHLLEACNYHCSHCFSKFENKRILDIEEWKTIIDHCMETIQVNEFNLAGGEPFLCPYLDDLIAYIQKKGKKCSIITNGSLLTREFLKKNGRSLSCIGFSIDSFSDETLRKMGRKNQKNEILTKERFSEMCQWIWEENPEYTIKLNTVLTPPPGKQFYK